MNWEGHRAYVGNLKNVRMFLMKSFKGISFVGSVGVNVKIILKHILTLYSIVFTICTSMFKTENSAF
jgi:hypothetical protein